jgi:hypothetical protein
MKLVPDAFMFKDCLSKMLEYFEGTLDYYQIVSHSNRV